jgi:hypothetical protein
MVVQERYLSDLRGAAATAAALGAARERGAGGAGGQGGRQRCGRPGRMTNILQSVTARPRPARNWMRCRLTESFVISVTVRMRFSSERTPMEQSPSTGNPNGAVPREAKGQTL